MRIVESAINIFKIPDLRWRIMFTLALLGVYRIGGYIPTPGVNTDRVAADVRAGSGHGARVRGSVFAAVSSAA